MIWVREDLHELFAGLSFEGFLALGQRLVKASATGARRTSYFERGGRRFFIKVHSGVGWREIGKNWLQLKRPVVDARVEARALERCAELGIPTARLAAYGCAGLNPARRRSFVVTEALEGTERLSELLARELLPGDSLALRRSVARSLGAIARALHAANLAHQDLYLTHFLARNERSGTPELYLVDLHRVREHHGSRGRVKDLAALRFSALDLPLTRTDLARFARAYGAGSSATRDPAFWSRIERRARALRDRRR